MLVETGRVAAIEDDALWVETIQRTTCESCSARHGCGQQVLSRLASGTTKIRVLLRGQSDEVFTVGQPVEIGIPENVIVKGALISYLLPLLLAVVGGWLGHRGGDLYAVLGTFGGLFAGGLLVLIYSRLARNNPHLQPVIVSTDVPCVVAFR